MGVEYERWLIAKGNFFSPSAASVAKLVERLRKEGWIVAPGSGELAKLRFQGKRAERAKATGGYAVKTVENTFGKDLVKKIAASTEALPASLDAAWIDEPDREELRLVWPVDCAGPLPCHYPLTRKPEGDVSYALEVHRCLEYVYPASENIGLISSICRCGEDLAFEWDDEELVPAFGASIGIFTECEACSRTFEPSKESALITNPFDGTSKQVPGGAAYLFALKIDCGECFVPDAALAFAPALVELVANEFGRDFYEVGCVS
ncbi:MAG: hypothetical protein ABIP89_19270 [Polyangiaceae bacterium]